MEREYSVSEKRKNKIDAEKNALKPKDFKKVTFENVGLVNREQLLYHFDTPERCQDILDIVNSNFKRISPDQYALRGEVMYVKRKGELVAVGETIGSKLYSFQEFINAVGLYGHGKRLRRYLNLSVNMFLYGELKKYR
tara:strand:+ start:577 stop:990 length:414 start_codon:yes stop_codon:yes gene_type:complete